MADTSLGTLDAIYNILSVDAPLIEKIGDRIYTYVPQNALMPYIRMRIGTRLDNTLEKSDFIHRVEIQTFDASQNIATCLEIRNLIYELLHRKHELLNITGAECSFIQADDFDSFIQEDGKTWQSFIGFEIHVTKI